MLDSVKLAQGKFNATNEGKKWVNKSLQQRHLLVQKDVACASPITKVRRAGESMSEKGVSVNNSSHGSLASINFLQLRVIYIKSKVGQQCVTVIGWWPSFFFGAWFRPMDRRLAADLALHFSHFAEGGGWVGPADRFLRLQINNLSKQNPFGGKRSKRCKSMWHVLPPSAPEVHPGGFVIWKKNFPTPLGRPEGRNRKRYRNAPPPAWTDGTAAGGRGDL